MKKIEITMKVDMNDPNSAMLYNVFRHLKRGHRTEILADNILFQQEVQDLIPILGDSPEMLAKILEMISQKHRLEPNRPRTQEIIEKETKPYQSKSITADQPNKAHTRSDNQIVTPKEKLVDLTSITPEQADTKHLLSNEEYEEKAVDIAREYIFSQLTEIEQRKLLMQWTYLTNEELYQELILDQLWFEYHPEKLPEGFGSMLEYTEHELSQMGYERKA
ncbi:hypothetical protein [Ruminococcus sp.]|uniref:hypothetical protein n=1 Tax=Ruminococcus sp. TaxID=41978 RepID=UPI0025831070|nr:hypothetical protein [Ruminococcus sp.]MCR5020365.1 hypothetical protein [Ruminococcus sp.]